MQGPLTSGHRGLAVGVDRRSLEASLAPLVRDCMFSPQRSIPNELYRYWAKQWLAEYLYERLDHPQETPSPMWVGVIVDDQFEDLELGNRDWTSLTDYYARILHELTQAAVPLLPSLGVAQQQLLHMDQEVTGVHFDSLSSQRMDLMVITSGPRGYERNLNAQ